MKFITSFFLKLWPRKIKYQLILGIVMVHMLIMILFIGDTISRQQALIKKQNKEQVAAIAKTIAANATAYIAANDLSALDRLITSNMAFPHLRYAMILSDDQMVLAHSNKVYLGLTPKDSISRMIKSSNDVQVLFANDDLLDVAVTIFNNRKTPVGWVRIGFSQENLKTGKVNLIRDGAIYTLLALLIGTLIAFAIGTRLVNELYRLIRGARRIIKGDHKFRVKDFRGYEIAEVGIAFNQMLDEISAKEMELSLVLESLPVGVWMLNAKGEIVYGNKAGKEIWGGVKYVGIEQFGAYKGWNVKSGETIKAGEWGAARAVLYGEEQFNDEIEIEAFDGNHKFILHSSLPIRNERGEITGAVVINNDISTLREAGKKLKESEEKYYSLFEQAGDIFCLADFNGQILEVNQSCCRVLGYSKAELLNMNIADIINVDSIAANPLRIDEIKRGEKVFSYRKVVNKNGAVLEVEINAQKTGDDQFFIIARDLTEIRTAERGKLLSELTFQTTFENSAIGMALLTPEARFQKVNKELCKILGYSIEEFDQLSFKQIIHPDDFPDWEKGLEDLTKGNLDVYRVNKRYIHKSGRVIWTNLHLSLVKTPDGSPRYLIAHIEDVTNEKMLFNLLQEREAQLRLFIEHSPAALAMLDVDMRYLITSKRWLSDYKIGEQSIIGKSHYEVFPEISNEWKEIHKRCLTGVIEKNSDDFFVREDGSIDWLKWEIYPWYKSNGAIGGIIMFTEITTHTKEAELKFRSLTEQSAVGVHIIQDGKYAYVNPLYANMFGMEQDEMIKKMSPFDLIVEEDLPVFEKHYIDRLERRSEFVRYEVRGKKKNGDIIWIEAYGSRIQLAGKIALIGSFVDITQRKIAELKLQQSEERNRLVLNSALDSIISIDENSFITYWNQQAAVIFGWDEDEVIGKKLSDLIIPMRHREAHKKGMYRYLQTGRGPVLNRLMELSAIDRKGREFPIELTITPVKQGSVLSFTAFIRDISSRKNAEAEIQNRVVQLQNISDNLPNIILYQLVREHDGTMKFVYISNGITKLTGLTQSAVIEDPVLLYQCIHKDDQVFVAKEEKRSFETMTDFKVEVRFRLLTGEVRLMKIHSVPRLLEDGRVLWDGIQTDVTEQHQQQMDVKRLNRLYKFISHANEVLLRSENKEQLFEESCRIAVEYGKVQMAWVGIINEHGFVVPVIWHGHEEGYLKSLNISVNSDDASGRGPTGRAIRNGTYYFCNDIASDPDMIPWKERALERGYYSSISYPIIVNHSLKAVFTLYVSEVNFFNETEIKLLQEVADNMSFTLDKIEVKQEQQRVEAELRKSEEINRAIIEAFPDKIFRLGKDGTVLDFHAFNENELYVNPETINGRTLVEMLPQEASNKLMNGLNEAFISGELVTLEYILPINGRNHFHEGRIVAMTNGEALLVARDITDAKEADLNLKKSMKETADYKYAIDQASMVDIADRKGNIIYANENFCSASKYNREELIGNNHKMLNSAYHSKDFFKELWKTVGAGKVWRGEIRERAKDNSFFWVDTTIVPFIGTDGTPYQYLSIRKDITARKDAEAEILKRNQEIKERAKELNCLYTISELASKQELSIIEIIRDAVDIIPFSYQYPEITCTQIRYNKEVYQSPEFAESEWVQKAHIVVNNKIAGVIEVYYKQPTPELYEGPFLKEERELIDSIARIIGGSAERKQASKNLMESEDKFRNLVEQSQTGVFILQKSRFRYVNPEFVKITGYSILNLLNNISIEQLIHDDDQEALQTGHLKLLGGDLDSLQTICKAFRSDGEMLHIEMISSKIIYDSQPAIIGSVIDITERVEEEKRIGKAVVDAQERERLEIGMELHDNVKQILAVSQLNLDIAKQRLKELQDPNELIDRSSSFIGDAIYELRRLSHQLAPVMDSSISFSEVISTLVSNINHDGKLNVSMNIAPIDHVLTHDIQVALYRILQEQFTNIQRHAEATLVTLSVKESEDDILMIIKDDGKGFDTTKKKTGIGMENIKRRAHLLGGSVYIQSKPGKGCELFVSIKKPRQVS